MPAIASLPPALRRLCLAAVAAMVFLLFRLGGEPVAAGALPAPWDKLAHFVLFAALAALLALGLERPQPLRLILLVALVGALDEWHQVYLPGREASLADFLTDVAAAVLAVGAVEWLRLRGLVGAARCR